MLNNVKYYRLTGKGLKRVFKEAGKTVTEYKLDSRDEWSLEPIECDDDDVYKWNPPESIKRLPRAEK